VLKESVAATLVLSADYQNGPALTPGQQNV